jgi:hypothetical protein
MNKIIKPYNMDEAIAVMAGSLHPKTCIRWLKLSRATQERLIRKAFDEGIITHTRGADEKLH